MSTNMQTAKQTMVCLQNGILRNSKKEWTTGIATTGMHLK